MKYVISFAVIFLSFFICRIEKNKFLNSIHNKIYDFGIYKMNPLRGEEAVKKARVGALLASIIPWLFCLIFTIYFIKWNLE